MNDVHVRNYGSGVRLARLLNSPGPHRACGYNVMEYSPRYRRHNSHGTPAVDRFEAGPDGADAPEGGGSALEPGRRPVTYGNLAVRPISRSSCRATLGSNVARWSSTFWASSTRPRLNWVRASWYQP